MVSSGHLRRLSCSGCVVPAREPARSQHLEALVTPLAEERRQSLIQIGRQIEAEKEEVRQKERAERVVRREYKRADLELREVDLENATSERKYPQGRL